jgi:hypothetical protein
MTNNASEGTSASIVRADKKHWYPYLTTGTTSQKAVKFTLTTTKTSDLTYFSFLFH